jgi:hypothetical protein
MSPAAAYDLIRLDEPPAHVEELLGLPPGDYRKNKSVIFTEDGRYTTFRADHPTWEELSWAFDECELLILVNEGGVVAAKRRLSGGAPRTFLQSLWFRVRYGLEM